ncbi:MAG: hypothetical protein GY953_47240 [bacterium]|nr:hypothetical protein [bacterium]
MSRLIPVLWLLSFFTAAADTIVLKNGETFQGDFFGATSQEIRFVVDGNLMYFRAAEVDLIRFGDGPVPEKPEPKPAPEPPAEAPAKPPVSPPPPAEPEPQPEPAEVSTEGHWVGAGTPLHVKLLEQVDMAADSLGSTYHGALDKPVRLTSEKGKPLAIPAGAEVQLRLVDKPELDSSETATGLEAIALRYRRHTIPIRTGKGFRQPRTAKERATGGLARAATRVGRTLGGMAGRTASTTAEETVGDTWDSSSKIPAGAMLEFLLIEGVDVAWPEQPGREPNQQPEQFVASAPPAK